LEADNIYKQLKENFDLTYPNGGQADSAYWRGTYLNYDWQMAQAKLKVFKCPSEDVDAPVDKGVAACMHLYQNSATIIYFSPPNTELPSGRTNYSGVGGACGNYPTNMDMASGNTDLTPYVGIFGNRSRTSLAVIPDGTSNTLMFGEGVGYDADPGMGHDFAWSWMGVGTVATKFGLGQPGLPSGNSKPGATWATFSSRHPAGVNFCFADGSVRMLRFGATTIRNPVPSPDWYLLQALGGIRDGVVITSGLE
jgi:prepilin-type processing-associated H-X9-DG protein